MSKVVNFADIDTRAEQAFQLRLTGMAVRKIAKQLNMTEAETQRAIESQCTPLSAQMRKHALEIELARLDRMEEIFDPAMQEQNTAAGHLVLKIKEFRADLIGHRAAVRIDATQIVQAEQLNTTDKIQKVLDEIAALPKPAKPDIEEE